MDQTYENHEIKIIKMTAKNMHLYNSFKSEVNLKGLMDLYLEKGLFKYNVIISEESTKTYNEHEIEVLSYIDSEEKLVLFAMDQDEVVGQLTLNLHWNKMGFIDDIRVKQNHKGKGIGTALINRAKDWTIAKGLGGLTLETQTNNIDACLFYEKCGFVIGGLDKHLYSQFSEVKDETAIFWYWLRGETN